MDKVLKLRNCPACEKQISVNAKACPSCGEPMVKTLDNGLKLNGADGLANDIKMNVHQFRKAMGIVLIIAVVISVMLFVYLYSMNMAEIQKFR